MSEMVMRVARALSEADQTADGDYRKLARAAIEAMREPTEAMIESGLNGWFSVEPSAIESDAVLKRSMRAALEAALSTAAPPVEAKSEVGG